MITFQNQIKSYTIMPLISRDKINAFESLTNEFRKILKPYTDFKNLELSNKQVYSYIFNLPFIFGIIADGKQSISESMNRIKYDVSFGIYPTDLPDDIFQQIEDVKGPMSDSEFNLNYLKEEDFLIKNFDEYEEMLTTLLAKYCDTTFSKDKYSLLRKMNLSADALLNKETSLSNSEWHFLEDYNLNFNQFTADSYDLTAEEWNQVYKLPYIAFYLISAADLKISRREKKEYNRFSEEYESEINPIIAHIFKQGRQVYDSNQKVFTEGMGASLIEEFKSIINLIDNKLPLFEAAEIKRIVLRLSFHIADAAGFAGISFVDDKESDLLTEMAKIMGLSKFNGKSIEFRHNIRIAGKEIESESLFKKYQAASSMNLLLNNIV